jgi:hypothetical protein
MILFDRLTTLYQVCGLDVASSNGALSLHHRLELARPLACAPRVSLSAEHANDTV